MRPSENPIGLTDKIWWLASYPKSGNTWLRMMLSGYLTEEVDINRNMINTSDIHKVYYQSASPVPIQELTTDQLATVRPVALMNAAMLWGMSPVLMKTHCANTTTAGMAVIPPALTAGAIYIMRDPRDIAISLSEHLNESLDFIIACMNEDKYALKNDAGIQQRLLSWSNHVKSWTEDLPFNVLLIRYEDMLERPDIILRKALQHLGIAINEKRLKKAVKLAAFEELQKQERTHGFREARRADHVFFKRGTSGGFATAMTDEQLRRIEYDHGEIMRKFGYKEITTNGSI